MSEQGEKKYEQIARRILDEINKGVWKEGEAVPTVRKLAELYGVSPQTANKATAHLVGLGYLSSRQGSGSVVTRRAESSGKTIPMLIDKARATYIRGVNTAMGYHGKEIYLAYLHAMEEAEESGKLIIYEKSAKTVPDTTVFDNAAGLLIQGTPPPCYLDYIRAADIPAVIINKEVSPSGTGRIGSVFMDDYGLEQLCIYLTSLGHRKIIYGFSKEFELTEVYQRRLGLIRRCLEQILPAEGFELIEFHFSPEEAEDAARLRQLAGEGCSALLCYNDITALRAYDLLHQLQIRIPEEMSIAGFDDLFMAEMAAPPLTTVRIDRTRLLEDSLALLRNLMSVEGPAYPVEKTRTELILRRSCLKSPS